MKRSTWRLIALLLALAGLFSWTVTVTAQTAQRQPADYLPLTGEIPMGFVYVASEDRDLSGTNTMGTQRTYVNQSVEASGGSTAVLQVSIILANSTDIASEALKSAVTDWTREGFIFEPLETLGEEGVVGRRAFRSSAERPSEIVLICFRVGAVTGLVVSADYADAPNYDRVLSLAQGIEARALTNPNPGITQEFQTVGGE